MALVTVDTSTHKNVRSKKRSTRFIRERMNYYGPRQRKADNRWDYTVERDSYITPVGYCAGWVEQKEADFRCFISTEFISAAMAEQERRRGNIAKYHADGHAHADEACYCYRVYLFDNLLRLDVKMYDTTKPCLICGTATDMCAEIDSHNFFVLCNMHRVKEEIATLYLRPGVFRVTSSY